MGKKWWILICFFSVLTFISSFICVILIHLSEESKTSINSNSILASNNIYINSTIQYDKSNKLNLYDLTPGYTYSNTFSITNNNSNTIYYNITWENVSSTWNTNSNHPEEFIYYLNCSNGEKTDKKQMPLNNSENIILENLELKTNKTNTCTITIEFIKTQSNEAYNLNNAFGGTYKININK